MRRAARWLVIPALLLGPACGAGTGPDGPRVLTARIDGETFSARFTSVQRGAGQVYVNAGASGERAIGFRFPDQGPGTYAVAPGSLVAAAVTIGNFVWSAGQSTGSGMIVLTTFTDSRITGTFMLNVVATQGQQPATRSVTDGQFDIEY
jgi:hypothetical protein